MYRLKLEYINEKLPFCVTLTDWYKIPKHQKHYYERIS